MTEFGTLHPDGTVTNLRSIPQQAMLECPHFIMVAKHYREDNTCRCNDPNHTEMADWGYVWDGNLWKAPEEEDSHERRPRIQQTANQVRPRMPSIHTPSGATHHPHPPWVQGGTAHRHHEHHTP